jgi:hypothetical protein
MLSGAASRQGYSLRLQGTVTAQEIQSLRAMLPPLTDGLVEALPAGFDKESKPLKVDVTCTRTWGAGQTCVEAAAAPVKRVHARRRR